MATPQTTATPLTMATDSGDTADDDYGTDDGNGTEESSGKMAADNNVDNTSDSDEWWNYEMQQQGVQVAAPSPSYPHSPVRATISSR